MRASTLWFIAAAALLSGCGRQEAPPKSAGAPPQTSQPPASPAATSLPDSSAAKDGVQAPQPQPGQANDHSTPEFKDGGKTESEKK